MERNTITTLGELQVGDRFTYPRRVDVWTVTEQIPPKNTAVNQFLPWGDKIHKFDEMKKNSTQVRFLRHEKNEV